MTMVAPTRLLISPYWKSLAVDTSLARQALFAQELRRTVAPTCRWLQPMGSKDPLYQWLIGDELFGRPRRRTGAPSLDTESWDEISIALS